MRLIDDKGRLFGIINLIDLSVLVLFLALIVSVSMNFISRPSGKARAEARKADEKMSVEVIETRVIFMNVMKSILQDPNVLAPGSSILGDRASVVKVLEVSDRPKDSSGVDLCNVTVLLRIKCVNLLGDYYCNNVPIRINSPLTISNPYYTLQSGIILGMRIVANE